MDIFWKHIKQNCGFFVKNTPCSLIFAKDFPPLCRLSKAGVKNIITYLLKMARRRFCRSGKMHYPVT